MIKNCIVYTKQTENSSTILYYSCQIVWNLIALIVGWLCTTFYSH